MSMTHIETFQKASTGTFTIDFKLKTQRLSNMGLFGLPDIKVETPNVNLDEVANAFVNTVTMGLAGVKDGKLDVKKAFGLAQLMKALVK